MTVTTTRTSLDSIVLGAATVAELSGRGELEVSGDASVLETFVGLLDTFEF